MRDIKGALPSVFRPRSAYSPGLDNVHRHRGSSGDQAADHAGTEVAQDVVREVAWRRQSRGWQSAHSWPRVGWGLRAQLGVSPESSKNCLDWE